MSRLDGQIVFLTGGAGGLGRPIARALCREGARVVVADIDADGGRDAAADLGDQARFVACDVREPSSWRDAVAAAGAAFGPPTALINNAGTTAVHRLEELASDDLRELTLANHFSVVYGMQAVFHGMRDAGGGSIVNVTSVSAGHGVGLNAGYAAAKGAVRALTLCAAVEWAPHGIRVNTVAPGTIDTPMARGGAYAALSNLEDRVRASVPLGRAGTPEEVAALVVYLVSDESRFCTGADFVLDGGQSAGHLRSLV